MTSPVENPGQHPPRVVVLVGNPRPGSRTRRAGETVAELLTGRAPDTVLDLADLGPALLGGGPDEAAEAVEDAVAQVRAAELLVVASPTYKAAYTGLLKLFLDRFPAGDLVGTTAVPLMLGGDWRHSLAPEAFLKPVLAEIGASTPTRGLFLLDSDAGPDSAALADWLAAARRQLPARLLDLDPAAQKAGAA